jgi:Na+/proline symporter
MVGGLVAANSSTILTHLNWGASYLVHDFYRRFIRPTPTRSTTCWRARWRRSCSFSALGRRLPARHAKDAFDVILPGRRGHGLLYLVRWFWWRVNAWCEVVAMVSSFVVSMVFLILQKNGVQVSTHKALILSVLTTSVCWIVTAYVGPETDKAVLVDFYRKVRPSGPGWEPVRVALA